MKLVKKSYTYINDDTKWGINFTSYSSILQTLFVTIRP